MRSPTGFGSILLAADANGSMMGILCRFATHQAPCSLCGQDAFLPAHGGMLRAIQCSRCELTVCRDCASQDDGGIRVLQCPRCRTGGFACYLEATLMPGSVWTMPWQHLPGWPDVTEIMYFHMAQRVKTHLPLLRSALLGAVAEQDLERILERLCLGLATAVYLEASSELHRYTWELPRPDFMAPPLTQMAAMIRDLLSAEAPSVPRIVILEDNQRRLAEMEAVLRETFPTIHIASYQDVPTCMDRNRSALRDVSLVCLDHDLEAPAEDPKKAMGDGRDAVRWLLSQPFQVPVLIHTTNSRCGAEMERMLQDAGWTVHWTPPFEDLAWIRRAWIRRVQEMVRRPSLVPPKGLSDTSPESSPPT